MKLVGLFSSFTPIIPLDYKGIKITNNNSLLVLMVPFNFSVLT